MRLGKQKIGQNNGSKVQGTFVIELKRKHSLDWAHPCRFMYLLQYVLCRPTAGLARFKLLGNLVASSLLPVCSSNTKGAGWIVRLSKQ